MTTNSPNPVDGDVKALIADCQAEIEKLEKAINNINSYVKPAYRNECLSKCRSEIMRQQIALAALTAEPVIYAIQDKDERENGYMTEFSSSGIAGYVNPEKYGLTELALYTTPPAQILRPVELPDISAGKYYTEEGTFMAFDYKRDLKAAIISVGGEVKS